MRIGVVSDTHDHLANVAKIVRLLNRAGVERVVHTGDIIRACTLEVLSGLEGHNAVGVVDLARLEPEIHLF